MKEEDVKKCYVSIKGQILSMNERCSGILTHIN
ncbi:MAG: hypothetical protein JWR38_1507 [Mucilaginibacter sp.]|nr:hypothetical protein [Mucilaginibacter sp.]